MCDILKYCSHRVPKRCGFVRGRQGEPMAQCLNNAMRIESLHSSKGHINDQVSKCEVGVYDRGTVGNPLGKDWEITSTHMQKYALSYCSYCNMCIQEAETEIKLLLIASN
jgi:hypothetical protein